MISRLTLSAVIFSIVGTASLAMAATVHQSAQAAQVAAKNVRVVQLETVTVVAKRAPQAN